MGAPFEHFKKKKNRTKNYEMKWGRAWRSSAHRACCSLLIQLPAGTSRCERVCAHGPRALGAVVAARLDVATCGPQAELGYTAKLNYNQIPSWHSGTHVCPWAGSWLSASLSTGTACAMAACGRASSFALSDCPRDFLSHAMFLASGKVRCT